VNINLVGDLGVPEVDPKRRGFLNSAAGQAVFEEIKAYYRNIAVWLAPPASIRCMNTRLCWRLLWSDRVMEAVLSTTSLRLAEVEPRILLLIGKHARDVLGRFAGQCQSIELILDLVLRPALPDLIPSVDPWRPDPPREGRQLDGVGWFDGMPLLEISFGAALVALREAVPQPDEQIVAELDFQKLEAVLAEGGRIGVERAIDSAARAAKAVPSQFKR
jgi:hypothetical protein